jgi:hypothetical protein
MRRTLTPEWFQQRHEQIQFDRCGQELCEEDMDFEEMLQMWMTSATIEKRGIFV